MSRVAALWDEWLDEDVFGDALGSVTLGPFGGGTPPQLTFPTTPLTVKVMLAFGADPSADPRHDFAWTDITSYVLQRDMIRIRRGRSDEQSQAQPSTCVLTLRNVNGRFSPRNPNGPYYGTFGKNTPLRVDVDPGTGPATRFVGFVSEWPPRWDVSGRDQYVPVVVSGILRRIGRTNTPTRSALGRAIVSGVSGQIPFAYWPVEDSAGSQQAASALAGGLAMSVSGSLTFASVDAGVGSDNLPDFSAGGSLTGSCPADQSGTSWGVHCAAVGAGTPVTTTLLSWSTTGSPISSWTLTITSGGVLQLAGAGAVLASGAVTFWDGGGHSILAGADNSGADVILWLFMDGSLVATPLQASQSAGKLIQVIANPLSASSSISGLGHIACYDSTVGGVPLEAVLTSALAGDVGETAGNRVISICGYEGVVVVVSGASQSEPMGAQPSASLIEILRDCEAADEARLYEKRDGRLAFDSHVTPENQAVRLALDYAQGHIAPPLEPTDDDRLIRNDVTISRTGGSSGRYVDDSGPLGVASIGRYDESTTLNLEDDAQAGRHAAYRVTHGTVDEMRFPKINLNFVRSPTLIADWLACDIGSRITIANTPEDIPPGPVDQIIEGYSEIFDSHVWMAELNCAPFSPYRIFRLAETTGDLNPFKGYLTPTSCVLAADLDTTSVSVTITSSTLWSTAADDWTPPPTITIEGEDMTVSAVAGSSNPQTLTVARSANGVVKAHAAGVAVAFKSPGVLGL